MKLNYRERLVYGRNGGRTGWVTTALEWLLRTRPKGYAECDELRCYQARASRHGQCVVCGAITHERRLRVNPASLRRELVWACWTRGLTCFNAVETMPTVRTKWDWSRPVPDQYPGITRRVIKDFLATGRLDRVLDGAVTTDVGSINQTIGSLGLNDEAYAELRSGRVVLRRLREGVAIMAEGRE